MDRLDLGGGFSIGPHPDPDMTRPVLMYTAGAAVMSVILADVDRRMLMAWLDEYERGRTGRG